MRGGLFQPTAGCGPRISGMYLGHRTNERFCQWKYPNHVSKHNYVLTYVNSDVTYFRRHRKSLPFQPGIFSLQMDKLINGIWKIRKRIKRLSILVRPVHDLLNITLFLLGF